MLLMSHLVAGIVNKDGLEDIYIGGVAYESGRLMIQKPGGRWQKVSTVFEADKASEDVDALFTNTQEFNPLGLGDSCRRAQSITRSIHRKNP